jgi:hypothetical protein
LTPTAVQDVADGHDTPSSSAFAASDRVGVDCSLQVPAFHREINGSSAPELVTVSPTAVHSLEEEQDTPSKPASLAPGGIDIGDTDHCPLLQISAMGRRMLALFCS